MNVCVIVIVRLYEWNVTKTNSCVHLNIIGKQISLYPYILEKKRGKKMQKKMPLYYMHYQYLLFLNPIYHQCTFISLTNKMRQQILIKHQCGPS